MVSSAWNGCVSRLYLPGVLNTEADRESKKWELDHRVFKTLKKHYKCLLIHMFATQMNNKTEN